MPHALSKAPHKNKSKLEDMITQRTACGAYLLTWDGIHELPLGQRSEILPTGSMAVRYSNVPTAHEAKRGVKLKYVLGEMRVTSALTVKI